MFKKIIASSAILALILSASPVWARHFDDEERLPRHAREIKKDVYDLGIAVDPLSSRPVRGRAYVHRLRNESATTSDALCYGYIGGGVRWPMRENFLFNASNNSGLSSTSLLNAFNGASAKWEDAADGTVDGSGPNVVGDASLTNSRLRADYSYPDNRNEAYFGRLSRSAIAVTVIWYTSSGQIVETDLVYNNRYPWSLSGEAGKMDFDNIDTHEKGHVFGLEDQYDASCSEATMYGYADYGETKKRDLAVADITGIDLLY